MKQLLKTFSLQSYAFQLRKLLVGGCSLDQLLSQHKQHQQFLATFAPQIDPVKLPLADRFAWKFLREINILNLRFLDQDNQQTDLVPKNKTDPGVYQNLTEIIGKVQAIWFPQMADLPNLAWLKHFSTRKLAHYAKTRDEIAFSLVFDSADAPPEILNYLAYHELLHRQVGSRLVNGRRYHHTGEFRNQEQLFPNWRDIESGISYYLAHTL
jgi:predicted metal-dependent hydrolase